MKKLFLILLAAGFFVTACNNNKDKGNTNTGNRDRDNYLNNNGNNEAENNNGGGWSAEEKQKAINACMDAMENKVDENAARNYCSCVLEKTMQKYISYAKADANATEAEGEAWGQQCLGELTNNTNNNNNGNNDAAWSRSDEDRFMNDCESSARKNVGAQRANEYCDCMLQKVKRIFSSYAEADRGLLQMPKDELDAMVAECNGGQ